MISSDIQRTKAVTVCNRFEVNSAILRTVTIGVDGNRVGIDGMLANGER